MTNRLRFAVYDGITVRCWRSRPSRPRGWSPTSRPKGPRKTPSTRALRWAREHDEVSRRKGIEALRAAVPDLQVVTLADVSHNFVIDSPEAGAAVINAYLERFHR